MNRIIYIFIVFLACTRAYAQNAVQAFDAPLDNKEWSAVENEISASDFDADFGGEAYTLGTFMLRPIITLEEQYNSNIYARDNIQDSDFITVVKPSLHVQKNIRDHRFSLNTGGEIRRYSDHQTENIKNAHINFRGTVIGTRRIKFPVDVSYRINHENRAEETLSVRSRHPFRFKTLRARAGVNYTFNRMNLSLMGGYQNERYDNGVSVSNTSLIRDDGDFDRYSTDLTLTYNARRNVRPYIKASYADASYRREAQGQTGVSTGVKRDNKAYAAYAGIMLDYKNIILGHAGIGHEWLDFDSGAISDVSALAAEVALEIKPTRRSSVLLKSARLVNEDNEVNDGRVQFKNKVTGRYELRSNLCAHGFLGYGYNDYETQGRTERFYSLGGGVQYTLNPSWKIGADIRHIRRDSTVNGQDFDQNVVAARVSKAF